tara:strand:- start:43 stop:435 length:393 start_codon:yes stop_codon:yes gene_type:complete
MKRISLSMLYLYAVGVVLVLGLVMPFDAHAGNFNLCVNGQSIYGGGSCGTNTTTTQTNSQRYVLQNNEAQHVMMSLNIREGATGIDGNGTFYRVGKYVGLKYREIQNRMFSCQAKPDASAFYCVSWPVMQ